MSFSSVWVSVPASTLEWAHNIDFQDRVGGWHSPPAQVPNAAFRESGGSFPRGWPYRGPFVSLFLCICFAFVFTLLLFFAFLLRFLCFLPQFFAISFKKYPVSEVHNSDRGPSLSAGHLSTWQAWASTFGVLLRLHGFTSDLPFQV